MVVNATVGLYWLFVVGGAVAFLACLIAYRQELREKVKPESPVVIMGVMFLFSVVMLAARLSADVGMIDSCKLIDPNKSWGEYLLWLAAGCFWL